MKESSSSNDYRRQPTAKSVFDVLRHGVSDVMRSCVPEVMRQDNADTVYQQARAVAAGASEPVPGGDAAVWSRKLGHVGLVAAGSPNSLTTVSVGLCLDDRAESVAQPGHEESWREWLRLSNLLAFKPIGLTIGSVNSSVSTGTLVETQVELLGLSESMLPMWRDLLAIATEAEKLVVVDFAAASLPVVPELGYEVLGIPVDFAWPDYKIVVVESPELQHELRNDRWTIVEANAEAILELLKSKGA